MDTYDAIVTKLDVKEFARKRVDGKIKTRILQAARFTGSSMNSQHWRFILVQDRERLATLAQDSTTGLWVKGADFAVIINTDPKVPGSNIDGGRVLQDMQLAAWNFGVVSRVFTGFKEPELRRDFGIPPELKPAAVLGFGYPVRKIKGKKNRKPLEELVSLEKYGNPYHPTEDAG
jgi:nitroreductase